MEREIASRDGSAPQVFHSLQQADYVTVLALTPAEEVVLIEQYRPAHEARTLELPGGLLDPGETPIECARRELREEAGFSAGRIELLGNLAPDTGRLENRLWAFLAADLTPSENWIAERDMQRHLMPKPEFRRAAISGRFDHALHIAVVALAILNGHF